MDEVEVDFVGRMQVVSLQPGDTLVLMVDEYVSDEVAARLRHELAGRFPGHEALVLGRNTRLGVVSKTDRLSEVERKLDLLIAALAEEQGEPESDLTLEGERMGGQRDTSRSLG